MKIDYNIHRDIVDRCIQGDRSAYHELYTLYSKAMYNTCLRITQDVADAEDVLQEAFVSAFNHIRSFKGDSTFGAWLKRIVVNKALTFINKKKIDWVGLEQEGIDVEDREEPVAFYNVENIKKSIDNLPEGYRIVLSLYLLEGYDHKEIAGILDITESTSKSQYNRAKKKLRALITKEAIYEN